MIPTLEGTVATSAGRRIAYSVAGPRDGLPVVYLHGGIGTPIRCAPRLGELIDRLHLRHVAISRPGFAGSDPYAGRRITDFPADVELVADHLGIRDFVLIGISSGGPYALATARALPHRIASLGLVSCLSPLAAPHHSSEMPLHVRFALGTFVRHPDRVERLADRVLAFAARHRHGLTKLAMLGANRADRRELADPKSRELASMSILEAASRGVRGMLDDYALCCRPWGFEVGDVQSEAHLWHGAEDEFVPLEHARALAAELPRCRAQIGTDDGHFFYRRRMELVLETLVTAARATPASRRPAPVPVLRAAA